MFFCFWEVHALRGNLRTVQFLVEFTEFAFRSQTAGPRRPAIYMAPTRNLPLRWAATSSLQTTDCTDETGHNTSHRRTSTAPRLQGVRLYHRKWKTLREKKKRTNRWTPHGTEHFRWRGPLDLDDVDLTFKSFIYKWVPYRCSLCLMHL